MENKLKLGLASLLIAGTLFASGCASRPTTKTDKDLCTDNFEEIYKQNKKDNEMYQRWKKEFKQSYSPTKQ